MSTDFFGGHGGAEPLPRAGPKVEVPATGNLCSDPHFQDLLWGMNFPPSRYVYLTWKGGAAGRS